MICSVSAKTLTGKLATTQKLNGKAAEAFSLVGSVATAYTANAATYEGAYEVTPQVEAQKLYTKQKYMLDDVSVHEIPFFGVSNEAGGNTVYIGTEIELS